MNILDHCPVFPDHRFCPPSFGHAGQKSGDVDVTGPRSIFKIEVNDWSRRIATFPAVSCIPFAVEGEQGDGLAGYPLQLTVRRSICAKLCRAHAGPFLERTTEGRRFRETGPLGNICNHELRIGQ